MNHPDWIRKQHDAIRKIAKPDWHYADVGACKGEILILLHEIMDKGYAFEANPTNAATLQQYFIDPKVTIISSAVGNMNGEASFYFGNNQEEGSLLGHDMNFTPLSDSIMVPSLTLDTYFKDKKIDFIKVDVEGSEWEVFGGSMKLLKEKDIIWQVEFHLDEHWDQRHFLYDLGYSIYDLDFNKLSVDDPRPYLAFVSKQELPNEN